MLTAWLDRRGVGKKVATAKPGQNPYEKWKAQKQKDLRKKQNALTAIESQVKDFLEFPWMEIGQHLKTYGTNQLKNEWHQHLNLEISVEKSQVDLSKFENGIYFLQLSSENKTATQKLIIQH